ncbi:MAG: type II toxin-antitoxin system VapC family toxin [Gemmataceae bacterium]|nr:type II toxin-antitoxin system VapC family toxin [Gemmataceae bacterium]
MTFAKIPANMALFLDANIFVYYFAPDPLFGPPCQLLMERISKYQEFVAYTSTHVLSEVSDQLMVLEAAQLFGWPLAGITQRLRRHPAEVCKLTRFRQAIEEVPCLGIEVLPVERHLMPLGASLSQLHGLLTNDALILASMQDQGITHVASNDADLDRVPGLTRYAPA